MDTAPPVCGADGIARRCRLFLALPLHDGHHNLNEGPEIGRALDVQPTAKQAHSLSDPLQAEVPLRAPLRVKPDSMIAHLQADFLPFLSQRDSHFPALAVPAGIAQGFLRDESDGKRPSPGRFHRSRAGGLR